MEESDGQRQRCGRAVGRGQNSQSDGEQVVHCTRCNLADDVAITKPSKHPPLVGNKRCAGWLCHSISLGRVVNNSAATTSV